MGQIIIRKACIDDLEVLLRFEQGVVTAERPFDVSLRAGDGVRYYDIVGLIERDDIELLVAEVDGVLIGSGYARIEASKPYLRYERHAYLGFMYVEPGFRGRGVNGLIMEGLKGWAASRDVFTFCLEVYVENGSAIRAYEKLGFSGVMLEMRLRG